MSTSSATPVISRFEVRGYIAMQSGEKTIGWYDTIEEANEALATSAKIVGYHTGYILDHMPK